MEFVHLLISIHENEREILVNESFSTIVSLVGRLNINWRPVTVNVTPTGSTKFDAVLHRQLVRFVIQTNYTS